MKRFFKCFYKKEETIISQNPIRTANPFPNLPDTLPELLYLETMIYVNLNTFNREADTLSEKAQMHIARGDMYKGMFFLRQRRFVVEETGKLIRLLNDIKAKKKYLEDFPAEFRAAQKIKL